MWRWNCVYQFSEHFQFITEKGSLLQRISTSQTKTLPALETTTSGRLLLESLFPRLQIPPTALPGQYNFSALLTSARQLLARETGSSQFFPKSSRTSYLITSVVVFCTAQSSTALVWRSAWFFSCLLRYSKAASSVPRELCGAQPLCREHKDATTNKSLMSSLQ